VGCGTGYSGGEIDTHASTFLGAGFRLDEHRLLFNDDNWAE
jgi:hypothetical protein